MISSVAVSLLSLSSWLFVLWIFPSCYLLSSVHGLALPEQELVNRRKSPALWRKDLSSTLAGNNGGINNKPIRKIQRPPEVMAPVGGWPQLHAAIANGADAVYVGLSAFSARARAANFDPLTELPQAVQTCHDAGVKLYVALNTLVFPHELEEVEILIRQCEKANVDALIVQDLGVARLAQTVASSMDIHASTQQTITSADGASFIAQTMGSTRVVLGRELSIQEIESVTNSLGQDGVEVEAFVHGALCVSYSGQCFSSEFIGGRSANRGQCAQACRLPYGLIDNGELKELGDFSYLLSPQDLCGLDHVPAMVRAGVACLKIEGRLKDATYVAATTRAYRNAVDNAWKEYLEEQGDDESTSPSPDAPTRQLSLPEEQVTKAELAQLFSRGQDEDHDGLSSGFFDGSRHQTLVRGRSPRHRGVHVGRVLEGSSWKNGLIITLDNNDKQESQPLLKRGDGLVVDRGMAQEEELGGPIFDIQTSRQTNGETVAHVRFSKSVEKKWRQLDAESRKLGAKEHAPVGAHVWKSSDATVDKKMRRLSEAPLPKTMQTATVSVTGKVGEPLVVTIVDEVTKHQGIGISEGKLQPAEKKELDDKAIRKAIGTLGNTDWTLKGIETEELEAGVWCPGSWIKEARRNAIEDLQSHIGSTSDSDNQNGIQRDSSYAESDGPMAQHLLGSLTENIRMESEDEASARSNVSVLARSYGQVDAICSMIERGEADGVDEIIVDFLEVDGMKEAVSRIRETATVKAVVASPRIIKPAESGIWRTLLRLEPDGLLVRSTGLLRRMMKLGGAGATVDVGPGGSEGGTEQTVSIPELIGDFSLNVANPLTAWELLTYGCSRVTASYDLNANGITGLLHEMEDMVENGASKVEIVSHAHLPIFHTEHCVFARFLSDGNSYLDCGHACTRHNVHLRDQSGADNLVLADMGCRNTVFASEAQSGVHSLKEWRAAGASRFRIELVDEGPSDVELIVSGYLSVLNEEIRASAVWETLKTVRDSNGRTGGVLHGSLRNGVVRRAGEVL